MSRLKARLTTLAAAGAVTLALAAPASAQTQQEGLVNVNVEDVTIQAPISVAANLCDVSAAVLVGRFDDAPARCDATAESLATPGAGNGGGGGPTQQEGLVNVNLEDITVQVPISVAANVCDVSVAVLVNRFADAPAACTATAESIATPGSGSQSRKG